MSPRLRIITLFLCFFLKRRKVPSPTRVTGGGEEKIMVWTRPFKKVSPCREADDRKAKLLKLEQSVFYVFELFPLNDRALYGKPVRGGTNS